LPDAVVENYDNLAYDLSAVYQVKSYDELAEILAANMESLIEQCPDADVDAAMAVEQQILRAPAAKPASPTKPAGTKPVTLKMDDVDDEEAPVVNARSSAKASASVDDDFLAEADAL